MKKTILLIVWGMFCVYFFGYGQSSATVSGVVRLADGGGLAGASVKLLAADGASAGAGESGENGSFGIKSSITSGIVLITYVGYHPIRFAFSPGNISGLVFTLEPLDDLLEQVQVIGYGKTSRRLNTGSVATVSAGVIERQPVTNVLAALSGRMSGVFVQTTNGLPGGNINVTIRGKGSLVAGTQPLYVVDGVPFDPVLAASNSAIATSAIGGAVSSLNSISPSDIESISVLKDAGATAIYGSRGSNGVILITTKKGASGKTKGMVNYSQGMSSVAEFPELLSVQEYLQMRKEAFVNDGLTPDAVSAPDLLVWGQQADTKWAEKLFGRTAVTRDALASVSGGTAETNFKTSLNYHGEGSVIDSRSLYTRGGISASLNHKTANNKLKLLLSSVLVLDQNKSANLLRATSGILLPPNQPLFNPDGSYYFLASNPIAEMEATTRSNTSNLNTALVVGYQLFSGLDLSVNAGYSKVNSEQVQLFPVRSLEPGSVNYAQYGVNSSRSLIVEPQLTFSRQIADRHQVNVLLGGTFQDRLYEGTFIKGSGYGSESLLENFASASAIDNRSSSFLQYRYISVFGRVNYNYREKYLLEGTLRRDGSSRFGQGNRFGNFGALSAGWIFSEEAWMKSALAILNFGKFRGSYGITGNDQITDYQYLSSYQSSGRVYQGLNTLAPLRIANSDFRWEATSKLDFGLELGFWDSRLLISAGHFLSRSRDQLVQYPIASSTGFTSYQANLPAVIENRGWELEVSGMPISKGNWKWNLSANLTIPKNKLLSFSNFESTSYASTYELGYDISRIKGYQILKVDEQTGKPIYADANGNPANDTPYNNFRFGKTSPDWYGGVGQTLAFKKWTVDVFFQFAKQQARGGITYLPGVMANGYKYLEQRWKKPGDQTIVPAASSLGDLFYSSSSANFFDASYLRFKNVSLSKEISKYFTVYLRGQNLLTWRKKGTALMDPESGGFSGLGRNIGPLKTYVAGLNFNF